MLGHAVNKDRHRSRPARAGARDECEGVDEGRVEADAAETGVETAAEDVRRVGVAEALGGHLERDVGGLDLDPRADLDASRLSASGELDAGGVGAV
jgi:hypothetical protein